jgi:hypothetical protein
MAPLLAIIPAIIGLGVDLSNQQGTPKTTTTPTTTPATITATQNVEKASIGQQAPNVLAQTSGLVNPEYVTQISQLLAGTGGTTGSTGAARQVVSQLFGLPGVPGAGGATAGTGAGTFTPAVTGTTPNPASSGADTRLTDFVNQFMFT